NDRIIIENSLNEYQVQREMLCLRTGCEAYKETAKYLSQLYILLRDSNIEKKAATITIIDRLILSIILQPEKISELTRIFLIYHHGGLLHDKSLSPIDDVYRITKNSSTFVDSIDEIRNLANKTKQSLRLVSSIGKKHLNRFIKSKKDCWLIITDIILFNDDLLQIRDFILSSIDDKIWHICNPSYASKVPRKF
ncbi:unnamed protein product, partial [Rotaria sordida]